VTEICYFATNFLSEIHSLPSSCLAPCAMYTGYKTMTGSIRDDSPGLRVLPDKSIRTNR